MLLEEFCGAKYKLEVKIAEVTFPKKVTFPSTDERIIGGRAGPARLEGAEEVGTINMPSDWEPLSLGEALVSIEMLKVWFEDEFRKSDLLSAAAPRSIMKIQSTIRYHRGSPREETMINVYKYFFGVGYICAKRRHRWSYSVSL